MEKRRAKDVLAVRDAKRRKQVPDSDPSSSPLTLFTTIWEAQERKRPLRHHFEVLPDKHIYPDYYGKISRPISLNEIRNKIDNHEYHGVDQCAADLLLMCENATTYNKSKSQVYSDALRIRNLTESYTTEASGGRGQATPATGSRGARTGPAAIQQAQVKIIEDLQNLKDSAGEYISYYFKKLPSKKTEPNYYRVIKAPISLNEVQSRVKQGTYPEWSSFEQAVLQIRKNAEEYNHESSDIVRDARTQEEYFLKRLHEEKSKLGPVASGIKLRFNMNTGTQKPHRDRDPSPEKPPASAPPKIKLNIGKSRNKSSIPKVSTPKISTPINDAPSPSPPAYGTTQPKEEPEPASRDSVPTATPSPALTPLTNETAQSPPNDAPAVAVSLRRQNSSMPPPPARLSATPVPHARYSPVPMIVAPTSVPSYNTGPTIYREPEFRAPGTDASSALISAVTLSSTSSLSSSDVFAATYLPDDTRVTVTYYLKVSAEFANITLSASVNFENLSGRQYQISCRQCVDSRSVKRIEGREQEEEGMWGFEARLVKGETNLVEVTLVTRAGEGNRVAVGGWEMERVRVFVAVA